MTPDITLPEVAAMHQNARFFRDGDRDMVEISFVGSKDTMVKRVGPEHMTRFREAWNAYCDGQPLTIRSGTPLSDVPGVDDKRADAFIKSNIHTAEELAALSDAQCQGVGHGTLTCRESARKVLATRHAEAMTAARDAVSRGAASVTAAPEQVADIGNLKAEVADLKQMLAALLQQMAPPPPAPPTTEPPQDADEPAGQSEARRPGRPRKFA